jgi:hypothetical protein
MDLKNLITEDTTTEVEHPNLDGFIVTVQYISKDKTKKILDRATTTKFSKLTRKIEEEVDSDLFLKIYTKELIKGWKGLKLSYLLELLPVDLGDEDPELELEYTEENALGLMKNSNDFENWISTVVNDVGNFNKPK